MSQDRTAVIHPDGAQPATHPDPEVAPRAKRRTYTAAYKLRILQEADPEGIPLPLLLSGTSDARFFSRLGIQTYGFTPMNLPADFRFTQAIHAADERIPVEAVGFGAEAIHEALRRYGK